MDLIYKAKYYDKVALSIPGHAKIIDKIIQIIDKVSYHVILDVGIGTGAIPIKLATKVFKIIAVDSSQGMLDRLNGKINRKHINNIQLIKGNIADWSFLWPNTAPILSECAFNSVICNFVLHHVNTKWKKIVLEELRDSLVSDGLLVIVGTSIKRTWKVKKLTNRFYWDMIKKTENKYPIRFIFKRIISYLFFEHPLTEKKWISLLSEIGFDGIKTKNFDNFILIWCRR